MKAKILLSLLLILALALPAFAETAAVPTIETDVAEIQKYGNLVLKVSGNTLLEQGYAYGDLVTVTIGGQELVMPVGSNYSDVDNGSMICRVAQAETADASTVILAINMGDLATTLGIAAKTKTEEEPGYRWDYAEAFADGVTVTIAMKEPGGYQDEYMLHQLSYSASREDYPNLTDEQYANFRNVATTGMGANVLYRSSSPVNPVNNRNTQADTAVNGAGIRTVMNLADSLETMKAYEGYPTTFYSALDVIPLNMGVDFQSAEFRADLAEGLRFIASREGPYLVHCTEGKDRAGFTCAILECLMGAPADEVVGDYMVTYYNYYGVEPGTEKYDAIAHSTIEKQLAAAFGIEDLTAEGVDLAVCARAFLKDIGMSDEEIDQLMTRLGTDIV